MGEYVHKILEKNADTMTGVCAVCGPVELRVDSGARRLGCAIKVRASRRANRIKTQYGLTISEWDAMLVAQSGRCLICNDPMRRPYVDHCHAGGQVRGLLCQGCNWGLGHFKDDIERLLAAVEYLKK